MKQLISLSLIFSYTVSLSSMNVVSEPPSPDEWLPFLGYHNFWHSKHADAFNNSLYRRLTHVLQYQKKFEVDHAAKQTAQYNSLLLPAILNYTLRFTTLVIILALYWGLFSFFNALINQMH